MPLEGFELLAIFEANDVLGCHRFLDGYGGFQFDFLRLNALDRGPAQSAIDRADEIRKLVAGKRIMSDVRRHDIGRQSELDRVQWFAYSCSRPFRGHRTKIRIDAPNVAGHVCLVFRIGISKRRWFYTIMRRSYEIII